MKDDNYLEQLNCVDMDLVDAAGEDRRNPSLDKKRWPRRILGKVLMAVITVAVVMVLISTVKRQMQWNVPSLSVGWGIREYADLICYEGRIYYLVDSPQTDAVGEKLGEIGASWNREPWPNEDGLISASVLYLGDPVHAWAGYDPADRICAQRETGEWAYYERVGYAEESRAVTEGNAATEGNTVPSDSAVDKIYYLGGTYTRYLGLDILGSVKVGDSVGTITEEHPDGAGRHSAGTVVHEWQGYDPWYRISIRGTDGGNYYYERWTEEELSQLSMAEYLPEDRQVTAISIRKLQGTEVGRITDPQVIAEFLQELRTEADFTGMKQERQLDKKTGRYMDLILEDGSSLRIVLYHETTGHSLGEIQLPEDFLKTLCSYEIYEIDESLGSVNYGSPLVAEWARPSVREVEPWADGQIVYTMGSVWLQGSQLCMGKGGCFRPLTNAVYTVLAEDVAGDVRVEDMEIWYRTLSGDVAYLYFWYPGDNFYSDLENGVDFSQYIEKQEILYEGPFVKLQVRDGVVWTLDENGILRRDGEEIAAAITCFVLDASGTIYGTDEGLYRLREADGERQKLTEGQITAVASGEMVVYYATAADELRQVWIDGGGDTLVQTMDVTKIQCTRIEDQRMLLLVDTQNQAWILEEGGVPVLVADKVQEVQMADDHAVYLRYLDGSVEAKWIWDLMVSAPQPTVE